MMTPREAKQRCELINARMVMQPTGEYRCTLNEWRGAEIERKAYYTDDAEDAYWTCSDMRRRADAQTR